jgi:hypothetical protein
MQGWSAHALRRGLPSGASATSAHDRAPPTSYHAGRLLFGRYPAMRRELIDEVGKLLP